MNVLSTAAYGAIAASNRFDKAATQTVRDTSQGSDILSDLVEQINARTAFSASISVFKTADEMLGRTLDIKA